MFMYSRARKLPRDAYDTVTVTEALRTLARRPNVLAPHLKMDGDSLKGVRFLEENDDGPIEYEVVEVQKQLVGSRFVKTAWIIDVKMIHRFNRDVPPKRQQCCWACDYDDVFRIVMDVGMSNTIAPSLQDRLASFECHPLLIGSAVAELDQDPFVMSWRDRARDWYDDMMMRVADELGVGRAPGLEFLLNEQMVWIQNLGYDMLKYLPFAARKKRKREDAAEFRPHIVKLDEEKITPNMLELLELLLSVAGFRKLAGEGGKRTWRALDAQAVRRLLSTPASLTAVNFLLKVKYFTKGMLINSSVASDVDASIIDPMRATNDVIVEKSIDKSWAYDDQDQMLPAWALRHAMVRDFCKRGDPRVMAYSEVYGEDGGNSLFEIDVSPRVIPGQAGAGADSRLELGGRIRVAYSWQAYTRDQPDQRMAAVFRST